MKFKLNCACGATCWARGSYEEDVNATYVNEEGLEWEGGSATCTHEIFEIVDHCYEEED